MMILVTFALLIISAVQVHQAEVCPNKQNEREFRGTWIATVANIDWPKAQNKSTSENKADLIKLLDKLEDARFNAIVFQVRPPGEVFYNSSIEPWSQYLTGVQGRAPDPWWDPLHFIIEEGHKRNMEVHAWINPYIAKSASSSSYLDPRNMARSFPDDARNYGHYIWMDPASQPVQDRIVAVAQEIVQGYDVDGFHLDDFFYPYPTAGDFPDYASYKRYVDSGGKLSKPDWRRNNVNKLISRLSTSIHEIKKFVKFGISPFGIWKPGHPPGISGTSSYDDLYCDSRMWLQKGWLDYLTPQLYWVIGGPQNFTALLDWWSAKEQNPQHHHIYPGLGDYRLEDDKTWSVAEIIEQLQVTRARRNHTVLGSIHFSSRDLENDIKGLTTALKSKIYTASALIPKLTYLGGVFPISAPNITVTGHQLDWSSSNDTNVRSWAVYHVNSDGCDLQAVLSISVKKMDVISTGKYMVSAVNRVGDEVESKMVTVVGTVVVG